MDVLLFQYNYNSTDHLHKISEQQSGCEIAFIVKIQYDINSQHDI